VSFGNKDRPREPQGGGASRKKERKRERERQTDRENTERTQREHRESTDRDRERQRDNRTRQAFFVDVDARWGTGETTPPAEDGGRGLGRPGSIPSSEGGLTAPAGCSVSSAVRLLVGADAPQTARSSTPKKSPCLRENSSR
jgi:hypothetical protein